MGIQPHKNQFQVSELQKKIKPKIYHYYQIIRTQYKFIVTRHK